MTMQPYPGYAGHRFPAEIISHAVWLYFRWLFSGSGVMVGKGAVAVGDSFWSDESGGRLTPPPSAEEPWG